MHQVAFITTTADVLNGEDVDVDPLISALGDLNIAAVPEVWHYASEQTINCSEEWRMLIPLWRTTETYLALEDSARTFERVHHLWRRRYRVGSDTHELRPKRRGRACQQLRANVALMAEWLHIMWREGWLGSARRNKSLAVTDQGRKAADSLAAKRSLLGLDKPYGTVAVKLKIGPFRPKPPPG